MAMAAISLAQLTLLSKSSIFLCRNRLGTFNFSVAFSTSSAPSFSNFSQKKWRQPVAASVVEIGGLKIAKEDVVRDDPTNNVPDAIFNKLGMQLHRRDKHPIGILKNAIYEYFDKNYSNKFEKFDNLCPIVSVKAE